MTSSRDARQPWEYAGGDAQVGVDIPITSEPRSEDAPGVPESRGSRRDGNQAGARRGEGSEEREVRSDDPELSAQTNQRLTAELREVVGKERVSVPVDRPRASRGQHPQQQGMAEFLNMHRFQVLRSFAIVLTFAAIVALATGDWWLLPVAAGVHALGTMTVLLTSIRMTTISEHPSPDVAAALSEDGINNPDEHFSRMVEEFRQEPEHDASEVLSPGFNDRSAPADTDAAAAAGEQSSAMTPTSQPSHPAGEGGAPDLLIWATVASLLALSIILPAVMGGGLMWLVTAVMVPLLAGWVVMQRVMIKRQEQAHVQGRRPMVAIVLCTAIAVAVFCAVIALAFQH